MTLLPDVYFRTSVEQAASGGTVLTHTSGTIYQKEDLWPSQSVTVPMSV